MSEILQSAIRSQYGATARSSLNNDHPGVRAVAAAFGYSAEELAAIPAEANMGLSCGNPTALANLRPGEVVVDLGSGGGLDVFLAARKVGPTGRAIGIDMTPDMVARAKAAAAKADNGRPLANVEFQLAPMEAMPLADASADVIISNCVVNLAPDKPAVFREMYRVLKSGGRVALSDIALKQELPAELADNVAAYVGCIAGAILMDDYVAGLRSAGFQDVVVVDSEADLNAYSAVEGQGGCCAPVAAPAESNCCEDTASTPSGGCCSPAPTALTVGGATKPTPDADPQLHEQLADLMRRYDLNAYAASVKVYAVKP